ncbi:hypothetical protein D9758_002115 [Tetrapyrgos nigripes]|uniref:Clathrin/coatomer adaptor adaptin-like N-terminal domain-containing protein n=1 Tax=Tetrapyrgos nigripes TaxID=182062 RepID=A0A8H5GTS1_9AGAR|nr:hypothetical protein D9758_002115 [Tetrapyrgos nigripes]
MNVPFIESGASSRSHYVLVKNLESAESLQVADRIIVDQVYSTLDKLADPKLSLTCPCRKRLCKEYLIILLYCYSNISNTGFLDIPLENALSNAATLAEAGRTVADKRIGYRFCAEMMPKNHHLQLLLVNTLRKDLESSAVPRICLALDYLISSASEDVIPAIQSRLEDLLQHNSLHVRRRVLVAFEVLSQYEPELLEKIVKVVIRRMSDHELAVSSASMAVVCSLYKTSDTTRTLIRRSLDEQLRSAWASYQHGRRQGSLVNILTVLQKIGVPEDEATILLTTEIITAAAERKDHGTSTPVLVRAAFLALPPFDVQGTLLSSQNVSPLRHVTYLLASHDLNDQYLFLTCLDSVSPALWAMSLDSNPPVLSEREVGQVMHFLDSSDSLVRKMTLKILNRVDESIIDSYYAQSLQTFPSDLTISAKTEYACRLSEVLQIRAAEDGEWYSKSVHGLLEHIESATSVQGQAEVLEVLVEMVLNHIRRASPNFRLQCATTFLTYLSELDVFLGPMQMIITAALACEYLGQVALSPLSLLLGFSSRLESCPPAVQDACLLAMLRVAADCEEVPQHVIDGASTVGQKSRRYIRRFVQLQSEKDTLARIVQEARSTSLPDFLESLQNVIVEAGSQSSRSRSQLSTPVHVSAQLSPHRPSTKLRYKAYAAPGTSSPLERPSSSTHSRPTSRQSDAQILGPGDLAVAVSSQEFESVMASPLCRNTANEGPTIRNDLISLDSPFVSDPLQSPGGSSIERLGDDIINFEDMWHSLEGGDNARGWYNDSMDKAVRRLQMMVDMKVQVIESSLPPFIGELKVVVMPREGTKGNCAILRLREEEDNSCLWRLRAASSAVFEALKSVLSQ